MNVVVKQAAESRKYPRSTSGSLQPNPPIPQPQPTIDAASAQAANARPANEDSSPDRRLLPKAAAKRVERRIARRTNEFAFFVLHSSFFILKSAIFPTSPPWGRQLVPNGYNL